MASEKSRHKAVASEGRRGTGEGSLSSSHPVFWGSHISLFPVCATTAASPSSDTVPFFSHFFHLRTQAAGAPVLTERQDTPKDALPHMTSSGIFWLPLHFWTHFCNADFNRGAAAGWACSDHSQQSPPWGKITGFCNSQGRCPPTKHHLDISGLFSLHRDPSVF